MSTRNNIPYVNFLKGTAEAYSKATKNENTLYFIYDSKDSTTGSLYLGSMKISDGKAEDIEILVDNLSLSKAEDGTLSLKDYGKKYYKYIAATETESAKYELTEGWIDGLELKASKDGGIGWYQPNPTTVDGLSNRLTTVEAKAESNATAISALDSNFDSRVNGLIANEVATLLSIKVVSSTDDIEADILDETVNAEKFLYMIPNGNIYDEYVVINGNTVEKIGSTEVDLTGYAKEEFVTNAVKDLATSASVTALGESLSAEIEGLKAKDSSIDEAIQELKDKDNSIDEAISGLTNRVDGIDGNIGELNEQIESILASNSAIEDRLETVEKQLTWDSIPE